MKSTLLRPYFTIHDSEFRQYTTRTQQPPNLVLGVTNPFFSKTLQHWPHIVRIGEANQTLKSKRPIINTKALDSKPGVFTRYKPFLNRDKELLAQLVKGSESDRPSEVQSALIRRFFIELTQSFIIPLERYVGSLMPFDRDINPLKAVPVMRDFDTEEFLHSLERAGPQLTTHIKGTMGCWIDLEFQITAYRENMVVLNAPQQTQHLMAPLGDWNGLYSKFLKSDNFQGWLYDRRVEITQKLVALHAERLSTTSLDSWVENKSEVEIVDLILRIRESMKALHFNEFSKSDDNLHKLSSHLDFLRKHLHHDLQSLLNFASDHTTKSVVVT